jgi:hypothetical protein
MLGRRNTHSLARFTVSKREPQNIAVNSLSGVGWVIPQKEGCAVSGNENAGGSETQQFCGVHPEALNRENSGRGENPRPRWLLIR